MAGITRIRGRQIKDESVESKDIASGSIKAGELSFEAILGQPTITNMDPFNDRLLLWSAGGNTLGQLSPFTMGSTFPSPYFFTDVSGQPAFKEQVATSGSFAFSNPPTFSVGVGGDVFFFVSGSIGNRYSTTPGTGSAAFGGDLVVTGALHVGEGLSAADASIVLDGHQPRIEFLENGEARALMEINDSDNLLFTLRSTNKNIVFKTNDAGTTREGLRIGGTVPEVVINEGSESLIDFRVESSAQTHMLFVDGGSDRIGIGTNQPEAALDIASHSIRIQNPRTPISATAAGNTGEIRWDADYIYICVATNTWKRAALSSW